MAHELTVEFDGGQAGRRVLRKFEERFGPSDSKIEDGELTVIWNSASDELIDAVVEEFKDGTTVMEIGLADTGE